MGLLILSVLLIALDVGAWLGGHDSRDDRDRNFRERKEWR
jgi:hypothetical protein